MPPTVMRPSSRHLRAPERTASRFLAAGGVFLLALVPRLVLFEQLRAIPFFRDPVSDSLLYVRLADAIGTGAAPAKAYFMSPLYPFFLAAIDAAGGDAYVWARLVQCAIGAAMCALLVPVGTMLASKRVGIIAAVIAAIYPLFWFYDNSILIESLQASLGVLHFHFLFRAFRDDRPGWYFGAGFSLGLLIVLRANTGLYAALLGGGRLVVRWRRPRGIRGPVVLLSAALLPLVPFALHNYRAEGVFLPVTSSAGFNFHAGNNAASPGLYAMPAGVDIATDPNGEKYAEARAGRSLNSAEVSSFWWRASREWILAHPAEYAMLLARKAVLYFSPREIDQLGLSPSFVRAEYGTVLGIRYPDFIVVLGLAIGGMILSRRRGLEAGILFLFIASAYLSTVAFFVGGRLRIPATPAYMLFAAVFLDAVAGAVRKGSLRALAVPAGGALAFIVFALAAQPAVRESFELEYTRLGQRAFERGDYPAAESLYRRSLREGETVHALLGAGNACAAQRKFPEARGFYERASVRAPGSALVYFNMGNALLQQGDAAGAYAAWRKSVQVQPEFAPAYRNLGLLLARVGRLDEALAALKTYRGLETDRARRAEIERDILAIERRASGGR